MALKYAYDPNSRLTNRWSVAKGNTGFAYDPVGNLTNIDYPASTDVRLKYDPFNRLTNMVDSAGTTTYTYTSGNQLQIENGPFADDTVTNTYLNRLRTSLALQQGTGTTPLWTNKFVYDLAPRLTNVTSPAGVFSYVFAPQRLSLITRVSLPNGSYITNGFESVGRLTGTWLNNSLNSTLDSATYAYNLAGQRTGFTNLAGTAVGYRYDNIGQLKVADSSVNSEDRGYFYDSAWNLNRLTNNGVVGNFNVDVKNQLTSDPSSMDAYDGNGNLTTRSGGYSYAYDDENRLVSLSFQTSYRTDFVYDGLSRLRKRIEYSWTGSTWFANSTTCYVYDGNLVIQERDAGNVPQVSYTRGTDLSGSLEGAGGIGGLLARSHGYSSGNWTTHNFYHADGNGNITYLVNSSETLAASYRYDPFGNLISSSGSLAAANVYRFSSKEFHVNSGLYYFLYRFYSPSLQRWLNRDPLGDEAFFWIYTRHGSWVEMESSRLESLENGYRFVHNSPFAYVDINGLEAGYTYLPGGRMEPPIKDLREPISCATDIKNQVWQKYGNPAPPLDPNFHYGHCVASCRIKRECPGGGATACVAGYCKEVKDQIIKWVGKGGPGFDWGDIVQTKQDATAAVVAPTNRAKRPAKAARGSPMRSAPCWFWTALSIAFVSCGVTELRDRQALLQAMAKTNASVSAIQSKIGPVPVYRKGASGWEELRKALGQSSSPQSQHIIERMEKSARVGFTSTINVRTFLFFNESDQLVDFYVDSQ